MMENTIIKEKLFDFVYYFLLEVEDNFKSYLYLLENGDGGGEALSKTGNIMASVANVIPTFGRGISSAIKYGDNFLNSKLNKDNAVLLSNLIYAHSNNKECIREVLVKAAYEIFCCYEMQFLQLTCKGGSTRAMQKLGCDAGKRYIHYNIKNKETAAAEITIENIINSIVHDHSNFLNTLGIVKLGRNLKDADNNSWNSSKIYTKVGVYINETGKFYKNQHTNSECYGHRRKFAHEDAISFQDNWSEDDLVYNYNYQSNLSSFDADFGEIKTFLYERNPDEFAHYDRSAKHAEILDAVEHSSETVREDIIKTSVDAHKHRIELHDDLKTNIQNDTNIVREHLEKILDNQTALAENDKRIQDTQEALKGNLVTLDDVENKIKEHQPDENVVQIPRIHKNQIIKEINKIPHKLKKIKF